MAGGKGTTPSQWTDRLCGMGREAGNLSSLVVLNQWFLTFSVPWPQQIKYETRDSLSILPSSQDPIHPFSSYCLSPQLLLLFCPCKLAVLTKNSHWSSEKITMKPGISESYLITIAKNVSGTFVCPMLGRQTDSFESAKLADTKDMSTGYDQEKYRC